MRLLHSIITGAIVLALAQLAQGQDGDKAFTKEISAITDNDNYLLQKRDGYYTNGFYFSYQYLSRARNPRTQKAIMRFELGQMIFNPYKYSVTRPVEMDRPFAGYLYAKATRSRFFAKGNNLQYGVAAGILGPGSQASEVQRAYHKLIRIYEVPGWGYQLKNEFGINLYAQYTHPLSPPPRPGRVVDLHAVARANLGNTFTNATGGFLLRIGRMENSAQSVSWNSRLHAARPTYRGKSEFFVFFRPEVMAQGYNATLQGGLFRSDKGPVTVALQPVLYQQWVGIAFAKGRFSAVLADVHRSKEARGMRRKENYGSVMLGYRML